MDEDEGHLFSYPSTSSVVDEGVISVDVSREVLVDSMTDMSHALLPPGIIGSSDESTTENEQETEKLTLAYERLYEIPKTIVEKFSEHIKYLDISHNKITNLDALVYFKNLTSLIADDNPITESCHLPPLPKLELLWLNRCKIASLYPWVGRLKESCPNLQYLSLMGNPAAPSYFNGGTFYEYLQYRLNRCKIASLYPWVGRLKESCPNLQYLSLMGNPAAPSYFNGGTFYEYLQYRLFIISQFPSLYHLDDRKVTEDQRFEAQRLYKRPFLERLVSPTGLNQISSSFSTVQNKFASLWGKDKNDRNLLI